MRGHGPGGQYRGRYSSAILSAWRQSILPWREEGCDIYVYFDNDQKSAAPKDALSIVRILSNRNAA